VKRFPESEDAFLFLAKSERDFKRQFSGVTNVSNLVLTVIVPAADLRKALEETEMLQTWLGTVAGQLIKQAYDQRKDNPKAP
jgi:hypothetical protein